MFGLNGMSMKLFEKTNIKKYLIILCNIDHIFNSKYAYLILFETLNNFYIKLKCSKYLLLVNVHDPGNIMK